MSGLVGLLVLDEKSQTIFLRWFGGGNEFGRFVDVFGFADFAVENNEENASLFV